MVSLSSKDTSEPLAKEHSKVSDENIWGQFCDKISVALSPSILLFPVGGPKRALLALFWAPGGLGPIRKRRFGRHAKTAGENGSNPIRLLKCHVRREKGPTRGPRGPSVAGRGAHVSPRGYFSGGQTKKNFGARNSQNANIVGFWALLASSVALGRLRRINWHPKHFHTMCLGGIHPYHALWPLKRPLLHSWGWH